MKWKIKPPLEFLSTARKSFRLKQYHPTAGTMQLLKDIYPGVDWNRVDFYEGLPWFTPTVAPYVTAQALPQFYSFGRFRIYLTKFDESRAQCLADIVHEAFHIMQGMHFLKGYGLGFFRGFMVYYNALFLRFGYRNNPFEIPAYDQEYRFLDYCARHGIAGMVPRVDTQALRAVAHEKNLVFPAYDFKYNGSTLYLVLSFIFCLVVSLAKPFADLFILAAGSLLAGFSKPKQQSTSSSVNR